MLILHCLNISDLPVGIPFFVDLPYFNLKQSDHYLWHYLFLLPFFGLSFSISFSSLNLTLGFLLEGVDIDLVVLKFYSLRQYMHCTVTMYNDASPLYISQDTQLS